MGTIVIGGGGALATGAFSTVTAERSVTVHVEEDAGALIGLVPNEDSEYVRTNTEGVFEIDLESLGDINVEATLTIEDAFTLTNNAAEPLDISFEDDSSEVALTFDGESNPTYENLGADTAIEDIDIGVETGIDTGDFDVTLTITAEPSE